jgi:hypothetical protein
MTTDGGGYILMGKMDSSITWNVPSTADPVEPNGAQHWASNLGEATVVDFRVQMATAEDFSNTVAHWLVFSNMFGPVVCSISKYNSYNQ